MANVQNNTTYCCRVRSRPPYGPAWVTFVWVSMGHVWDSLLKPFCSQTVLALPSP